MSAVQHKDPRGRRRAIGWDRAATLKPIDLETHTQLLDAHKIMSGRGRGYVYWWRKGKLHWRRYVVPRDPRTPTQQRSRAAFRDATKAWSENQPLTEEQRNAWRAEAAKTKSTPRLGQSGFLTEQQHFVGRNSVKERWGLPLLLEPPKQERKKEAWRMQKTEPAPEVSQPQRLNSTSSDPRRAGTGPSLGPHRVAKGRIGRPSALRVPIQVQHYQALTQPSSDRPRTTPRPLLGQCRWQACTLRRIGGIGSPRSSSTLAHISRNARFRQLWRGG
jgi:hypothetical protein